MAFAGLRLAARAAASVLLLLAAAPAGADGYDDVGGFEEADEEFKLDAEAYEDAEPAPERWWEIDGSVGLSSSVNYLSHRSATGTQYRGLSRLRARLNLEIDLQLPHEWKLRASPYVWYDFAYLINGFSRYTGAVKDEYEWEWNFQDSYIEGPLLDDVDLKIGRQVVNWGNSDSVRVLDVLNPLDNREPARADIEDLRRSVGMAKLDWYLGPHWTLTGIAIPEIRFDDLPPVGSDFNPSPLPALPELVPDDFENWEGAVAVRGIFEGWDVSAHFAYLFDDFPSLRAGLPPSPTNPLGLYATHDRLLFVGAGGNYAFGSWLLKSEAAWTDGFEFLGVAKERSRLDVMAGVEYYGLSEATVALEVVERHLFGHNSTIRAAPNSTREDAVEYALRYTADWFHARLSTTLLAVLLGAKVQDGAVLRAQGDYTIRDGLVLTAGILIFQKGRLAPLDTWGHNDRLFFDIKWSF